MKRTRLKDRLLPSYTMGEEIMNMVTHISGGGLAILGSVPCIWKSASLGAATLTGALIYCVTLICVYTMSSIYHGLRPSTGKKVLQILDHCTIYLLIAGSYSAIALGTLFDPFPILAMAVLAAQWGLAALAITLTAIDLEKYNVFSMVCYIGMGWCVIFAIKTVIAAIGMAGFWLLLAGGIAYTVGAVLYGIGSKVRYMHSVFHLFVLAGSVLHFLCILLYVL